MAWNPDIYNKFKSERYAPFYDLISLCRQRTGLQVIDLGCGTGELTGLLADHLPGSQVTGIDASLEMLKQARSSANGKLQFKQNTIQDQLQENTKWDLIFSNAALQWLDDHEKLFPQIIAHIREGGQLAVQVPSNTDHFTHTALMELAGQEPFKEALSGWARNLSVLSISEYADILFREGGTEIIVYEKVYAHLLKDADSLFDWVSGTALIPYIEKLPPFLAGRFRETYKKKLAEKFPGSPVFYPFKRILMSAFF